MFEAYILYIEASPYLREKSSLSAILQSFISEDFIYKKKQQYLTYLRK